MNILIIDDQPDVVDGMLSGIHWAELQIKDTFYAYDIIHANEIIKENTINIMLCDIEMPLGSGLELYEWVAEFYPDIKCIFLTSHEDFSYAQKALRLGSFDYLIQPAPYTAIETAIKKASILIKQEQKQKQYSIYKCFTTSWNSIIFMHMGFLNKSMIFMSFRLLPVQWNVCTNYLILQ